MSQRPNCWDSAVIPQEMDPGGLVVLLGLLAL